MISPDIKNKKGFILIASYMVIMVLVILATAFSTRSLGERRVADKDRDALQAFWLAEAGIDKAISELSTISLDTRISNTLGSGKTYTYYVQQLNPIKYLINSKGGIPGTAKNDANNIIYRVESIVEYPISNADSSSVTSAITASGDVTVGGNTEVNGVIDDNAIVDFEETFGVSKETMENNVVNILTDPENNVPGVTSSTWVNLDLIDEMKISDSGWTGNGILVVNGDLRITGGHFEGIIWVIGTLWVSGNPIIDGAIYAESGAEFETTLTGNPTVNFDNEAISDAFGFLPSNIPPYLTGWRERTESPWGWEL